MCRGVTPPSGTIVNGLPVSYSRQCATHSNSIAKTVRPRPMPTDSPFSRACAHARANCSQKSDRMTPKGLLNGVGCPVLNKQEMPRARGLSQKVRQACRRRKEQLRPRDAEKPDQRCRLSLISAGRSIPTDLRNFVNRTHAKSPIGAVLKIS